jgi:hypothetical protein
MRTWTTCGEVLAACHLVAKAEEELNRKNRLQID